MSNEHSKAFKDMTREEKKERIAKLWSRVRTTANLSITLKARQKEREAIERANFGLDSDVEPLSESQEREEQLYLQTNQQAKPLAWYLVNEETNWSRFTTILVQLLNWYSLLITPVLIVFEGRTHHFDAMKDFLLGTEWVVDVIWALKIYSNFITADKYNTTFMEIAKQYLKLWFWIDALATFPAIITLQRNKIALVLKMLRMAHLRHMLLPVRVLLDHVLMKDSITK